MARETPESAASLFAVFRNRGRPAICHVWTAPLGKGILVGAASAAGAVMSPAIRRTHEALDRRAKSGKPDVKPQTPWGMSVQMAVASQREPLMASHDPGIQQISARRNHCCYGMGLGIIILDDIYPGFPGDVRNASAYPFPIQFEIAEGVDIKKLVRGNEKDDLLEPVLAAARKLERMGCRAIAAECGYFAWFQKELASAVNVPVFASSLLQVPMAQALIGADKVVGILVAEGDHLHDRHLSSVGVKLGSNYVVHGAKDGGKCPQFDSLWTKDLRPETPTADYAMAERDIVAVAKEFAGAHPTMRAMVLECTGFQPFARAVQREIEMPVFSWSTLLDYAYSIAAHRDFYGHV